MSALDGFKIGEGNWLSVINEYGRSIRPDFWDDFKPVPESDIVTCEKEINRPFPADFREFWRIKGSGQFAGRVNGDIYSPKEVVLGCDGSIHMCVKDAYRQGADIVRRLYITRGSENLAPNVFSPATMRLDDIAFVDLIQVGTDGMCCYHQLVTDGGISGFGYCLLTNSCEIENKQPDFSAALVSILTQIAEMHQE